MEIIDFLFGFDKNSNGKLILQIKELEFERKTV